MSKEGNISFQVLILDVDRNPIRDQKYRLFFNGAMVTGKTEEDGLTKKIRTHSSSDEVQIAVERIDGSIKIVAKMIAGEGRKLVTLISPKIKVEGATVPHPSTVSGGVPSKSEPTSPSYTPQKPKIPTEKQKYGPDTELIKNKEGNPIAKIEGDIPNLEFLEKFNGEVMTEKDYLWAANELDIEYAAIKAFAIVESDGAGFLKVGNETFPAILYERHKFARFTKNAYSRLNPDISLPCAYYNNLDRYILADDAHKSKRNIPSDIYYYRSVNKKDSEESRSQAAYFEDLIKQGKLDRAKHVYLNGLGSYKRLIKAYKLDPVAALESCSWGSFQIMGEFWREMGYGSAVEFSKSMSRSPKDQIKAFVLYIKYVNPKIRKFLKCKNWAAAAEAYNGPAYKVNRYHIKLEAAYNNFRGEKS